MFPLLKRDGLALPYAVLMLVFVFFSMAAFDCFSTAIYKVSGVQLQRRLQ